METLNDSSVQVLSGLDGLSAWRTLRTEDTPNSPRRPGMPPRPIVAELAGTNLGLDFSTVTGFANRNKLYLGGALVLGLGYWLYSQNKLPFLHHPTAASAQRLAMQMAGLSGYARPHRRHRSHGRRRRSRR
jgi:hypothetical protein